MQQVPPQGKRRALSSRDVLDRANQALAQNDYERAFHCCNLVIRKEPHIAEAHFIAGKTAMAVKDRDDAIRAFQLVIELETHHLPAWVNLARAYVLNGRYDKAAVIHERLQPEDKTIPPEYYGFIIKTLIMLEDFQQATKWFQAALEVTPDNADIWAGSANNWICIGDTDNAKVEVDRALSLDHKNAYAHWIFAAIEG